MLGSEYQEQTVTEKRGSYLSLKLNEVAKAHETTVHAWAVDAGVLPSAVFGALGGHRGLSPTILQKLANVEKMGVTLAQLKAWAALDKMDPDARAYILGDERMATARAAQADAIAQFPAGGRRRRGNYTDADFQNSQHAGPIGAGEAAEGEHTGEPT